MASPISAELPIVSPEPTDDVRVRRRPFDPEPVDLDASSSFERFYLEHRDAVARAVAVAIGDIDQAADSTDEAMIRAFQRWDRVSELERPAGWVFRVAVNHSRSRLRRLARKARYASLLGSDRHDDRHFAEQFDDRSLVGALQALDADRRAVVVLRVLLEFSERECAESLGIRPGTAKSRLHRGLAQLRDALPHLAPDIAALTDAANDDKDPR